MFTIILSAATCLQAEEALKTFDDEAMKVIEDLKQRIDFRGAFTPELYGKLADAIDEASDDDAGRDLLENARDSADGKTKSSVFVGYLKTALPANKPRGMIARAQKMFDSSKAYVESHPDEFLKDGVHFEVLTDAARTLAGGYADTNQPLAAYKTMTLYDVFAGEGEFTNFGASFVRAEADAQLDEWLAPMRPDLQIAAYCDAANAAMTPPPVQPLPDLGTACDS